MIEIQPKNRERVYKTAARLVYDYLSLVGNCSVELLFVKEKKIQKLNSEFRGIDKPTDVLSFPLIDNVLPFNEDNYPFVFEDGKVLLGSIVICKEIAESNALIYGHSILRELVYLFVHGLLHLLGFDHIMETDKQKMRKVEEEILSKMQITR